VLAAQEASIRNAQVPQGIIDAVIEVLVEHTDSATAISNAAMN
jgi:hypothetical protein